MSELGGLYIVAREALWPRPKLFDVGPAWTFDYGAVADPELFFYEAFGVSRGSLLQMFGPGVLAAGYRAHRKGHENGPRSGDIYRMPGVFLVRGDRVLWQHVYRHAGDQPDFRRIPDAARASA